MPSGGWANLYGWRIDRRSTTPLSRQIYMQIRSAVLAGALGPGAVLPSSRAMASRLGVARASVIAAYAHLSTEGYIESQPGSATRISTNLDGLVGWRRPAAKAVKPRLLPAPARAFAEFERPGSLAESRPFNTGRTLLDARTMETWRMLTHRAVRTLGANDLGYTDPCGSLELRRT